MSEYSEPLRRTLHYFETLTADQVQQVDQIYDVNAEFTDPFNKVRGVAPIKSIYTDMFVMLDQPRFQVKEALETGDQSTDQQHQAFVTWDLVFHFRSVTPEIEQRIHGSTHFRFGRNGLIQYHHDYWDSARIYEKLPVIGRVFPWLKSRIAIPELAKQ